MKKSLPFVRADGDTGCSFSISAYLPSYFDSKPETSIRRLSVDTDTAAWQYLDFNLMYVLVACGGRKHVGFASKCFHSIDGWSS